jgi:hypothetical protein
MFFMYAGYKVARQLVRTWVHPRTLNSLWETAKLGAVEKFSVVTSEFLNETCSGTQKPLPLVPHRDAQKNGTI